MNLAHRIASVAVFGIASIAAQHASAANCDVSTDQGGWEDAAALNQRMGAEDQHILLVARFTNEFDFRQSPQGSTHTIAVTTNIVGSTGYVIESDGLPDEAASRMCVEDKLSNVHLYAQGLSDTMSQAYLGGMPGLPSPPTSQSAAKTCELLVSSGKVGKDGCNFLDTELARLAGEGQHPLIRANGVGRSGEPLTSVVITITGNMGGKAGSKDAKNNVGAIFYSLLPSGATTYGHPFIFPTFGRYAVEKLNEGVGKP